MLRSFDHGRHTGDFHEVPGRRLLGLFELILLRHSLLVRYLYDERVAVRFGGVDDDVHRPIEVRIVEPHADRRLIGIVVEQFLQFFSDEFGFSLGVASFKVAKICSGRLFGA